MPLDVIRSNQAIPTRWKNNLGESRLILRSPPDGEPGDFDWQVGTATMSGTLPFSDYPGIDRSLCVIGGQGLRIRSQLRDLVLTKESAPFHFQGEEKIVGTTLGQDVMQDFNILSRRDGFTHRARRVSVPPEGVAHPVGDISIIYVQTGRATVTLGSQSVEMDTGDTAIARDSNLGHCQIASQQDSVCIIGDITYSAGTRR